MKKIEEEVPSNAMGQNSIASRDIHLGRKGVKRRDDKNLGKEITLTDNRTKKNKQPVILKRFKKFVGK